MSGSRIYAALTIIGLAMPAMAATAATAEKAAPDCDSVAACGSLAPAAAGPALLRFLQDENWDIRVEAALALGSIEYKPSVPGLVTALSKESDWQLVYAAIISLGRMKDQAALKPLQEVAASYWYPPVRVAAECAVQSIESGKPCDGHEEILNIDFTSLQVSSTDLENCGQRPYSGEKEAEDVKQYGNEEVMREFKYTGEECEWFGDADKATGVRPCLGRRKLYPKIAARVGDGWLTGSDRGEFGGELMFFPDTGKPYEILKANVEDIFALEKGVVALTGLAHLTNNRGMVYSLRKDGSGKWKGEALLRLPGAPEWSYKISKKEIVVKAYGGMVVIDDQGNPKMAVCGRKQKK